MSRRFSVINLNLILIKIVFGRLMDVHSLLLCHVWNIDLHFLTEKWTFILQTAHPLVVVFVVIHQHNSFSIT